MWQWNSTFIADSRRDLPANVPVIAARLRLTYVDTHGELHEVQLKEPNTDRCQQLLKIGNNKSGTFSVPTSEQAWISRIMNPKMGDYWLDGLLSMKSYSLCHVKSTYQFMELAYSWSQTHSAIHSNIAKIPFYMQRINVRGHTLFSTCLPDVC